MDRRLTKPKLMALASGIALSLSLAAAPAQAAPVLTSVGANLADGPFTFSNQGGTFTFGSTGDIFGPLSVMTGGTGTILSVFGSPSPFFTNRGTVQIGPDTLGNFMSFPSATQVRFSNGDNFIGLRATSGGQDYYGFAYTTNSILNGYGFETTPGTAITATTQLAAAVPEPSTWMMMLFGFGMIGYGMRSAKRRSDEKFETKIKNITFGVA